jgi:hypothetical protein
LKFDAEVRFGGKANQIPNRGLWIVFRYGQMGNAMTERVPLPYWSLAGLQQLALETD